MMIVPGTGSWTGCHLFRDHDKKGPPALAEMIQLQEWISHPWPGASKTDPGHGLERRSENHRGTISNTPSKYVRLITVTYSLPPLYPYVAAN